MRRKWPLIAGVAVALAVAAGLIFLYRFNGGSRVASTARAAPTPAPVAEISAPGRVQATEVVNVPATTEGVIERQLADVGDDVYQGELLAHISSPKLASADQETAVEANRARAKVADLEGALIAARLEASRARADASRAKADYDRAEKNYLRQQMLMREGATPRLVFEKAEKDFNTLKTDSQGSGELAARAEDRVLSLTRELDAARKIAVAKSEDADEAKAETAAADVRSSVDGIVVGRRGQAGESVNRAMQDLFQIAVNVNALQVVVTPDPQLLPRVRSGQPALIQIAEVPSGIPGTVREIRAGQVFVAFTSPSRDVRPGLTAQVRIKLT
jgi:multidrug efflux pump subunit AcrA (membrane-fusion protein)